MKNNVRHNKRVRKLILLTFLCAMILGVSTYAWFIGMKTVNVSSFNVRIATTEGLYISMDAESWAYNLSVTDAEQADINTNKIENVELIPVSTVGEMDKTSSTMIMFEKGSFTAADGGYRLLASRVHNYIVDGDASTSATIGDGKIVGVENPRVPKTGYVAFDLYIKNVSGEEYYVENNPDNEEAIYLTTNSKVTVGSAGTPNTGIENSVRVAFAQIGRVEDVVENYGDALATKITCLTDSAAEAANKKITGICRNATIWEPNDKAHVQNAINWYTTSLVGSGQPLGDATYPVAGSQFATYAIKNEIDEKVEPQINVYDRTESDYLALVDTFTDTEKMLQGTARPTFMTLAPNSITKVRVYVYLEGQDADNYDFAQLGKEISIQFGFTKERFQESDINYEGPNTYITPTNSTVYGEQMNGSEIEYGQDNGITNSALIDETSTARR